MRVAWKPRYKSWPNSCSFAWTRMCWSSPAAARIVLPGQRSSGERLLHLHTAGHASTSGPAVEVAVVGIGTRRAECLLKVCAGAQRLAIERAVVGGDGVRLLAALSPEDGRTSGHFEHLRREGVVADRDAHGRRNGWGDRRRGRGRHSRNAPGRQSRNERRRGALSGGARERDAGHELCVLVRDKHAAFAGDRRDL